jgi:hypothetical protein
MSPVPASSDRRPCTMPLPRASGGIGRRAGFRFLWAISPWGFKSPLAHELLSQRTRPRRLRLLVPVLLTAFVAGVVAIITLGSRSPAETLYAEDLRDTAVEAARASMVFRDLLERATTVDRAELTSVVDEVEDLLEAVNGSQPPPEVGPEARALRSLLTSASAAWLEGVVGFETALLRAADDPAAVAMQDSMTASLATLGSGDRIYAAFLEAATAPALPQPVSGYPEVRFLPQGFPLAATVDALVAYARAPLSPLRLRADVGIEQVTTDPAWVENQQGTLVVEATDLIDVVVVVSNLGNAEAATGEILFDLTSLGEPLESRVSEVPPLAPGAKTTIVFEGVAVVPGTPYAMVVRLGVLPPEQQTDDNLYQNEFLVNEPVDSGSDG